MFIWLAPFLIDLPACGPRSRRHAPNFSFFPLFFPGGKLLSAAQSTLYRGFFQKAPFSGSKITHETYTGNKKERGGEGRGKEKEEGGGGRKCFLFLCREILK
jgi:hypothetical protein